MRVKQGSTIHLNLQLEGGATDKFPQAILRDQAGVQIGSPIDLTHTGNGLYQDDSQVMPNTDEVTVTYLVFEDSGHTVESCLYGDALDVYTLDRTLSIVENIQSSLNSLVSGSLPGDILEGFIEDGGELVGQIFDSHPILVGEIMDEGTLEGFIFTEEDDALVGLIDITPADQLVGLIEC